MLLLLIYYNHAFGGKKKKGKTTHISPKITPKPHTNTEPNQKPKEPRIYKKYKML